MSNRKIVLEGVAPKLTTEELHALMKLIKGRMKKAFEAGYEAGWYVASTFELEDEKHPGFEEFETWFKNKYK